MPSSKTWHKTPSEEGGEPPGEGEGMEINLEEGRLLNRDIAVKEEPVASVFGSIFAAGEGLSQRRRGGGR